MASPTFTGGSAGNGKSSATLAAGATATAFAIDATTAFEVRLQVGGTFGTIGTPSGLQVNIAEKVGSTPVADTALHPASFTLAAASGAKAQSVHLPVGRYDVSIANLDPTNSVTNVYATYDLTPAVS